MSDYDLVAQIEKMEADARLGLEMEQFRRSPAYRYLIAKSELEALRAAEDLVDATPSDMNEIIRLQSTVKRLRDFQTWIIEAIERGQAAHEQLREAEQNSVE